jgi:DNA-binding transcriptional regulator WhiA
MHSLTISVKDELVTVTPEHTSQRHAELSTILRFAGGLHVISGNIAVEVELDHLEAAKRVRRDIRDLFGMATDAAVMQPSGNRSHPVYVGIFYLGVSLYFAVFCARSLFSWVLAVSLRESFASGFSRSRHGGPLYDDSFSQTRS